MKLRYAYLIFIVSVALFACGEKSTKHNKNENANVRKALEKPKLEINLEEKSAYYIGYEYKLDVSSADSLKYDSVKMQINRVSVDIKKALPFSYNWSTSNYGHLGNNQILVLLFYKGKVFQYNKNITLLSDLEPKKMTYEVVKSYKHDIDAYTQGLIFSDGFLYEATGLKGYSTVRKTKIGSSEVLQTLTAPADIFGEGITIVGDKLIQLSWSEQVGLVYDLKTFNLLERFSYETEGWGLTHDKNNLLMSDGTNKIYVLDPISYTVVKHIEVYDNKGAVSKLNELEYINGDIYANIYTTDIIAIIDRNSGKVKAYVDMAGLLKNNEIKPDTDVLNGIAYDHSNNKLYVTGKKWPKLFEIKIK